MSDSLVYICAKGTMRILNLFHFMQNVVFVQNVVNNFVLEYWSFNLFCR